jgi:hypothetical protein
VARTLYEHSSTWNLRDAIATARTAAAAAAATATVAPIESAEPLPVIVIEMSAHGSEQELRLRELVEDSPSMAPCSTVRSATGKAGLLFCVWVGGAHAAERSAASAPQQQQQQQLSPELLSRASLVLQ